MRGRLLDCDRESVVVEGDEGAEVGADLGGGKGWPPVVGKVPQRPKGFPRPPAYT